LRSKNKGRKFEDKVVKSIGSGNLWFSPLDVHYENKAIECKFTEKKGFRISLDLLENIWSKALDVNKQPYLIIGIKRNETEIFMLKCDISLERKDS
jgi:hypothetical protein